MPCKQSWRTRARGGPARLASRSGGRIRFAEPRSRQLQLKPDVRRALVHAPTTGELFDDVQSPSANVLKVAMAQLVLKPAALIDDLHQQPVLIQASTQDDPVTVSHSVPSQLAEQQLGALQHVARHAAGAQTPQRLTRGARRSRSARQLHLKIDPFSQPQHVPPRCARARTPIADRKRAGNRRTRDQADQASAFRDPPSVCATTRALWVSTNGPWVQLRGRGADRGHAPVGRNGSRSLCTQHSSGSRSCRSALPRSSSRFALA